MNQGLINRCTDGDYILSCSDSFSLVEESPYNRPIESIILIMERSDKNAPYPVHDLIDTLNTLVSSQPRYKSRVDQSLGKFVDMGPEWKVDDHISVVRLKTDDDSALQDYVSELQNKEMPRDRPLWDIHVVENYYKGYALFWRVHHSNLLSHGC
jgi:hypothetical protein